MAEHGLLRKDADGTVHCICGRSFPDPVKFYRHRTAPKELKA